MWPTIVLSWFFPCRNICAENYVFFFTKFSSCLLTLYYLQTRQCWRTVTYRARRTAQCFMTTALFLKKIPAMCFRNTSTSTHCLSYEFHWLREIDYAPTATLCYTSIWRYHTRNYFHRELSLNDDSVNIIYYKNHCHEAYNSIHMSFTIVKQIDTLTALSLWWPI